MVTHRLHYHLLPDWHKGWNGLLICWDKPLSFIPSEFNLTVKNKTRRACVVATLNDEGFLTWDWAYFGACCSLASNHTQVCLLDLPLSLWWDSVQPDQMYFFQVVYYIHRRNCVILLLNSVNSHCFESRKKQSQIFSFGIYFKSLPPGRVPQHPPPCGCLSITRTLFSQHQGTA